MNEITSYSTTIKQLLFYAAGKNVEQEIDHYIQSPNRKLLAFEMNGKITGCLGIEILTANECVIKHIAVTPAHRGAGIGTKMMDYVTNRYPIVHAETDYKAVGFYTTYGFEVSSLGEKYLGVERFKCTYTGHIIG